MLFVLPQRLDLLRYIQQFSAYGIKKQWALSVEKTVAYFLRSGRHQASIQEFGRKF